MITIEKDDFTGLRKINSSFYGLYKFLPWPDLSISDAFDLLYLERGTYAFFEVLGMSCD